MMIPMNGYKIWVDLPDGWRMPDSDGTVVHTPESINRQITADIHDLAEMLERVYGVTIEIDVEVTT